MPSRFFRLAKAGSCSVKIGIVCCPEPSATIRGSFLYMCRHRGAFGLLKYAVSSSYAYAIAPWQRQANYGICNFIGTDHACSIQLLYYYCLPDSNSKFLGDGN